MFQTGDPNDISLSLDGLYGYQNVVVHTVQVLGSGSYGNVVKTTLDRQPGNTGLHATRGPFPPTSLLRQD